MTKEQLLNRIWNTKKARMNAEERLNRWDSGLSVLITYYSIFFVAIETFPRFTNLTSSNELSWISTSCSLFVLIFSTLIAGRNYKLQAEKMKNSYLDISTLEAELEKSGNVDEVFQKYNLVMKQSDNHSWIDFAWITIFKKGKDESCCGVFERHTRILTVWLLKWSVFCTLMITPIIIFYIYIFKKLTFGADTP